VGKEPIQALAKIVTYALLANIFFFLCEVFVALYSEIPGHVDHLSYLFVGLHGHALLAPWMWLAWIMSIAAVAMLLFPGIRANEKLLITACVLTVAGIWIDKGLGLISGGFIPNPLHQITEYLPTIPEVLITLGVYGIGILVLTLLFKIAVTVREETM
jgi:molybdopterin-containing oxidoreductase family membrane subunit